MGNLHCGKKSKKEEVKKEKNRAEAGSSPPQAHTLQDDLDNRYELTKAIWNSADCRRKADLFAEQTGVLLGLNMELKWRKETWELRLFDRLYDSRLVFRFPDSVAKAVCELEVLTKLEKIRKGEISDMSVWININNGDLDILGSK